MKNWSESFQFSATEIATPESTEALQTVIAEAPTAKAIGTRHSFNAVADSPGGVLVDVSTLRDVHLAIDHEQMTASVPAGWTYSQAVRELEAAGVALGNLASLPHISVAGATATGTHGSGDRNPMMSAEIVGVEVVDGEGQLRVVGEGHPDLGALSLGLGAFGVFTRVVFAVRPTFQVQQDYYRSAPWENVLANLDDIFASAYSVNIHGDFSTDTVRGVWRKHVCDSGEIMVSPERLFGLTLERGQLPNAATTRLHKPGPWSVRLAHFRPDAAPSTGGDELQSEYFVSRAHAVDALDALRSIGDRIDPHLWGAEIRTVASDDLWISPATGRDTLSIGLTWRKHPEAVHDLLPVVESTLEPFDARPHWGKLFAMEAPRLHALYPRLAEFNALRATYDPAATFASPFLDSLVD